MHNQNGCKLSSCEQQKATGAEKCRANCSPVSVCCRLKEQQLKEAQESAAVIDKGRATAERATDSARQTKQRMESELARLQRLVTELEQSKR